MHLTVLGAAGTHPSASEPCSGYLLEAGGRQIVLDLGPGTFGRLLGLLPIHAVDAIVVSHGHPDHCADLLAWYHTARYAAAPRASVPLLTPPEVVDRLAGFLLDPKDNLHLAFDHQPVRAGSHASVGEVEISFGSVVHPVPAVATRIEYGGRSVVYTGDTAPSGALSAFAQGCDLFICDATTLSDPIEGVHCDVAEAAAMAAEAGVGSLLLTHVRPGEDLERMVAVARSIYDGPVDVARSGLTLTIG